MAPTQRAIIIDRSLIVDKVSFHQVFAAAFGFPEFYGRKVAAWIDCMSSLDEAFCAVQVEPGQVVVIEFQQAQTLQDGCHSAGIH